MFPKDFVWGVASSAYQIEGRDKEDGAGTCIWNTFAKERKVFEGQDAMVSCDHIHRYKEDFALMRLLGVKHYRFSLSWSRIIPNGTGEVNPKAISLYRDMISEMKKTGLSLILPCFTGNFPRPFRTKEDG